ncbi:MAG TPA: DUF1570 domain-containing protein [Phycisphaerae bacterium]|mgnify:FL=1|nr:DUF1570 domain-containing protein [Phycisphaerae bacterium]
MLDPLASPIARCCKPVSIVCRALVLLLGGTAVLAAGCAGASARPVAFETREWVSPAGLRGVQILTEHYDLRTTSADTVLRDVLPVFVESAYREYAWLIPPEQPAGERMVVYIFRNRQEWALFTRRFAPAHADTYLHILSGGYMDQATGTSVLWDVKRDHTLALLAHEGLHQYLARQRSGPIPAWLNEGLATQFEDFDLEGYRPVFRPQRNLLRKNSLREALSIPDSMIPLNKLLSMHAGEAVVRPGQRARGYYAQVWITVLFLQHSPQYRDAFARLLDDVGTDRMRDNINAYRATTPEAADLSDGEILFRHYITQELDDFEDELRAYARRLVY